MNIESLPPHSHSHSNDDRAHQLMVRKSVSVPTSLCGGANDNDMPEMKKNKKFSIRAPLMNFIRTVSNSSTQSSLSSSISNSDIDEDEQEQEQDENDDVIVTSISYLSSPSLSPKQNGQAIDKIEEATVEPIQFTQCHRALQIPEILRMVFQFIDEENVVPHEQAPKRRSPMSLRHALLLYGDTPSARQAWKAAQQQQEEQEREQAQQKQLELNGSNRNCLGTGLHSCLLVNSQWNAIAHDVLFGKLHFKSTQKWQSFAENAVITPNVTSRAKMLVLHKIHADQSDIDRISASGVAGNLSWLEFYTCPNITPTRELLQGGRITRVVLPGCNRVDDRALKLIAENCPKLEYLDLRACELVTDRGLRAVARNCPKLKLLNVGRTQRGQMITHRGVKHIIRRCNVDTLGLAGCMIDDRTMWEVAMRRGKRMERLSLNNCTLLTNASIPKILAYTTRLSVLELRGCTQITDMRPIVLFKKFRQRVGKPPLVEGCEVFELRMKEAEWLLEMEWSRQVFKDCLEWIYAEDDDVTIEEAGLV